jgi:antirestriction protein ArdC
VIGMAKTKTRKGGRKSTNTTPMPGEKITRADVYQLVTDAILDRLREGTIPWRKPWSGALAEGGWHRNVVTGRAYRGINVFLLDMAGFEKPWWMTMRQANQMGGHVRKGEHASIVTFWKRLRVKPRDGYTGKLDAEGMAIIFMLRYYRVFNIEQIDGIEWEWPEPDDQEEAVEPEVPVEQGLIDALDSWCADEKIGRDDTSGGAWYMPVPDHVSMPPADAFSSGASHAATLAHECTHATGHANRLGRDGITKITTTRGVQYAKEELVAEMGAAMICARFGVAHADDDLDQRAAYIASWLHALEEDPRMVVNAAANAQKAADLICGPLDEDTTNEEEQ